MRGLAELVRRPDVVGVVEQEAVDVVEGERQRQRVRERVIGRARRRAPREGSRAAAGGIDSDVVRAAGLRAKDDPRLGAAVRTLVVRRDPGQAPDRRALVDAEASVQRPQGGLERHRAGRSGCPRPPERGVRLLVAVPGLIELGARLRGGEVRRPRSSGERSTAGEAVVGRRRELTAPVENEVAERVVARGARNGDGVDGSGGHADAQRLRAEARCRMRRARSTRSPP